MSKLKMNTKQKILDKALQMFNERGIEYVGLRELAGILDIRVGNITYYFPTKDDLVYELSQELSRKNSQIIVPSTDLTMFGFLEIQHKVFQNHVQFRCLMLSFVHIIQQNPLLANAYSKTQKLRRDTIRNNIGALVNNGYLRIGDDGELDFLVSTLALISRFWISEATISFRQTNSEEQIRYYLDLLTRLFTPYCTARGKNDIRRFVDNAKQ